MHWNEMLFPAGALAVLAMISTRAIARRRRRAAASAAAPPDRPAALPAEGSDGDGAAPPLGDLLRQTLRRDLELAAEHVSSIRWLLEIARQHQQPIPNAALTNLALVSKQLAEMQRRFAAVNDEIAGEPAFSGSGDPREIRAHLHPRRPAFECRVSPFDRSAPSD